MPSFLIDYFPGSGFVPLVSGNPWSGQFTPVGGIQLRADKNNSGAIYISLSGANPFSGVFGLPPTSGGPTIYSGGYSRSGGLSVSGWGAMDGFPLWAGDSYFVPLTAVRNTGPTSGTYGLCVGQDAVCSGGFARIHMERI